MVATEVQALHGNGKFLVQNAQRECIVKAAWQLEDVLKDKHARAYPSDLHARELHIKAGQASIEYITALEVMVLLTIFETPSWCQTDSDLFVNWDPNDRCSIPGVDQKELLLSNLPYLPPGLGVLIEVALVFVIARKLLLDRKLQLWYFSPLKIQYNSMPIIHFGLAMVILELVDCVIFIVFRPSWRLAFVARTGYLVMLPEVQRLALCIQAVVGEILFIAAFYASTIVFFAWIAVTIFKDVDDYNFGQQVNKGLDTFGHSLNTMFVSGSTEEFMDCLMPSYTAYRQSGLLWLFFLVVVQLLLRNLVLDTVVAAYMKHSEQISEDTAKDKVRGIIKAYSMLLRLEQPGARAEESEPAVPKETFLQFVTEFSRSPWNRSIPSSSADILFTAIDKDGSGLIDKFEFCTICRVIEYDFWTTRMYSPVKEFLPGLWSSRAFSWFREQLEQGRFDTFMDYVLLLNLALIIYETVCDMNNIPEMGLVLDLELTFSLIYVLEVGLKLCVNSWDEYWSSRSNQFDFVVTWLLLATSALDDILSSNAGGNLKRYMNILRLMRLLRMMKQLKRWFPVVQQMVETISKLVSSSKDIFKVLGIVIFFFSSLGVQLWGGLLYLSNSALEETEYKEKDLLVLNFNDFGMSFGVWVVMLLCEYVACLPDAIDEVSGIPGTWVVFVIFYMVGVCVVFELVKAFTIEVFMDLRKEWDKEPEEFETLDTVIEECHHLGRNFHYRSGGDLRSQEKITEAINEIAEEEERERAHSANGLGDCALMRDPH